MSRSARLLDLLQVLRRHRYPVRGEKLATELGVSLRTLYRDIATLQAQGASIEGEAGVGYVLKPGFTLPPLMFSMEEIEAVILGARWVARQGDPKLALAAQNVLAKIGEVAPAELRDELASSTLLVVSASDQEPITVELAELRRAVREERKIQIVYLDQKQTQTTRVIWPFALGFFDRVRIVSAWCETRQAFRHFRADRMRQLVVLPSRYPKRRRTLLREWQQTEGIRLPEGI